jgi:hypothetical protein
MENLLPSVKLKNEINRLEDELLIKGQLLKEQFKQTYLVFKPASLIKNTLKDITSSPYLIENILVSILGLASGYVTRKIITGASNNIFRKLIGSLVQFGVTNIVAQHPESVTSLGQSIFQRIKNKKEKRLILTETVSPQKLLS